MALRRQCRGEVGNSMNLADSLKQTEKEYEIGGGDYFKFEEGDNKIRVLTMWEPLATHFVGSGRKKEPHVCYGKDKGCPYHDEGAPLDDESGLPKNPTVRFVTYICDRKDSDRVKIAALPYTVVKAITALQGDEDYMFDNFPMPYDVKITYDRNASGSAMYNVVPSPNREPLPDFVMNGMITKKDIIRIVDEKKSKEAFGGK
jgi:hypothetical protein